MLLDRAGSSLICTSIPALEGEKGLGMAEVRQEVTRNEGMNPGQGTTAKAIKASLPHLGDQTDQ